MNLIGLLDRPTSGRLVLAGEDTTALDHDRLAGLRNRRIGFVFQAYNLLARNTTLENVEMPLVYSGLRGGKRRLGRARRSRRSACRIASTIGRASSRAASSSASRSRARSSATRR